MENNDKKIPMLKQLLEDIVGNLSEEKIVDSFHWKLYNSITVQIILSMYNHSYLQLKNPSILEYVIVR